MEDSTFIAVITVIAVLNEILRWFLRLLPSGEPNPHKKMKRSVFSKKKKKVDYDYSRYAINSKDRYATNSKDRYAINSKEEDDNDYSKFVTKRKKHSRRL